MEKKNVVLSVCLNYSYDIFHRFVGSLFDSVVTNVDLILFISINDVKHCEELQEKYTNLKYIVIENLKNMHIVNYRFAIYYKYLQEYNNYDYVFICDSRDVLFQKDIFTHPLLEINKDLYIFLEETNITIDKCKFNSRYVEKSGLDVNIVNKPIICVGTILGNIKGIMEYLKEFNYILDNIIKEENKIHYGSDSAINYKILFENRLQNIEIYYSQNSECLVYTMAYPIFFNLINYSNLLDNNNYINYNNNICYCVHQYDRLDIVFKKKMSSVYNYLE